MKTYPTRVGFGEVLAVIRCEGNTCADELVDFNNDRAGFDVKAF